VTQTSQFINEGSIEITLIVSLIIKFNIILDCVEDKYCREDGVEYGGSIIVEGKLKNIVWDDNFNFIEKLFFLKLFRVTTPNTS